MSRADAIARAVDELESGRLVERLARRVAIPTESQREGATPELLAYLEGEMIPELEGLGFSCRIVPNPIEGAGPFLIAKRTEDPALPTVLGYGHGDVVMGEPELWTRGEGPWTLAQEGERLYGRGLADNKGQHAINLAALAAVLASRGQLGFNAAMVIETGEETGSPGLAELARQEADALRADMLIASDGPRFARHRPTIFLGNRGSFNFELAVELREGGHHSGNWGGVLANPAVILAHALASITDAKGRILVEGWRPEGGFPDNVRRALAGLELDLDDDDPAIDPDWGEPGLSPVERLYGWNTFEILALEAGNPVRPINAIPPKARAVGHMRYVVGTDPEAILPALRRHLDAHGFEQVRVAPLRKGSLPASRLDPDHPFVDFALASLQRTTGKRPACLPNFGGALPNHVFSEILGMPTIWVPHSYAGCQQHGPDEHVLIPVVREGLAIMAGLFWDLGDSWPDDNGEKR